MNLDSIPLWAFFVAPMLLVFLSVEAGYRVGKFVHLKTGLEKESTVSTITTTILTVLGFILAFTFGIVSDRHEARMQLIRDEANAIGTAWLRAGFLPEQDHKKADSLFVEYIDLRIQVVKSFDKKELNKAIKRTGEIQQQLWDMAAKVANKDQNSDIFSLYVDALNDMFDIQSTRIGVTMQSWLPIGTWIVLFLLLALGIFSLGFQMAISDSGRSWVVIILAITFSVTIFLIAALDRPITNFIQLSQQPLIDQQATMHQDMDKMQ